MAKRGAFLEMIKPEYEYQIEYEPEPDGYGNNYCEVCRQDTRGTYYTYEGNPEHRYWECEECGTRWS